MMAPTCFLSAQGSNVRLAAPAALAKQRVPQTAAPIAAGHAPSPGTVAALSAAALLMSSGRRAWRGHRGAAVARNSVKAPVKIEGAPEKSKTVAAEMRDQDELARYKVVFSAEDGTPEWTAGKVVATEVGDASTLVSIEVESSREFIALSRAFRSPGQRAALKFGEDATEEVLPVASPPLSLAASRGQLWRLKGDIYAGETKKEAAPESLPYAVKVLRPNSAGQVEPGDAVQVGPFTDEGVDLRPVLGRFQAQSVVVFCDGSPEALCSLRSTFEATDCACEMQLRERTAVLLFCGPAPGLPAPLSSWLDGVQESFNLPIADLGCSPLDSWHEAAVPAIRRLMQLGQNVGAIVLGAPDFVTAMTGRLDAEGVSLISTSADVQPLARTVESEQI